MVAMAVRLRRSGLAQDAALAVLVALMQIVGTRHVAADQESVRPLAHPTQLGYLLLALSGLALLARRRWPVAALVGIGLVSLLYYASGYPDGPGWIALFVATYTLAAYGDGRRSLAIAVAVIVVLTAGWLLMADLQPLIAAGWVFFRIGGAVMAAALGESVRARRVLAAEALRRAEHAERTREEEARRRVDAERLRIAREVHDTLAHAIAVINVQAGVTAHVLDKRPERARETLLTIERTSARALHELRATLGMLRDSEDDVRAPEPGLEQLGQLADTARQAGIEVTVERRCPGLELPSAVNQAAYRILQESITNVIRHAGATHLMIALRCGDRELEIRVEDDGVGSRERTGAGGGGGIVGMRERCALLGGKLAAEPRSGGGFLVRARLPLAPELAVRT